VLDRIVAHHDRGGRVASVCSGSFALADAGLLDGRRATTHHEVQDEMARRYPAVKVVRDVLFVAEGRVFTSAGIASGIDLALHLVAADHGPAVAARTARSLVVPARRNGAAPQDSAMLRHRDHLADLVHRAQDVLDARFTEPLPLPELAGLLGVSPRTLTRHFRAATGITPLRYQHELRLERARALLDQGWSQDSAAHEVGFTDARMLRRLRASQRMRDAAAG
jgi:transcriptional regulator GlxA family with amidase domain